MIHRRLGARARRCTQLGTSLIGMHMLGVATGNQHGRGHRREPRGRGNVEEGVTGVEGGATMALGANRWRQGGTRADDEQRGSLRGFEGVGAIRGTGPSVEPV